MSLCVHLHRWSKTLTVQIWNIKIVEVPLPKGLHLPHLEVSPGSYPSVWAWSRWISGWSLWTIIILIPIADSLYVPVCTWVILGFLGCCFSWDCVLESEWGLFTPPLLHAFPLSWDGFGSWSTVSYLFRDRPATRTGPQLSATHQCAR